MLESSRTMAKKNRFFCSLLLEKTVGEMVDSLSFGLRSSLQGFCTSSEEICTSLGLFERNWSRTWNTTCETKEMDKWKKTSVKNRQMVFHVSFSFVSTSGDNYAISKQPKGSQYFCFQVKYYSALFTAHTWKYFFCYSSLICLLLPSPPPQTLVGNSSEGLQPTHSQSSSSAGAHGLGGGTLTRPLNPEGI